MAEPIAALIVRILADTSDIVEGTKKTITQLDGLENRVAKFGKALAGVFTVQALIGFSKQILAEVDQIDTAAKRIGASSEEFQRFSYAIKQSGGDAEGATAGIMSLTDKLSNGDAGLLGVLRKLNIDLDKFKAMDAIERFTTLATAIANVTDPTQRLELRLEAMGTKGEKALAAVDDKFRELAAHAPVYSEETIQALKKADDAFDLFWTHVRIKAAEAMMWRERGVFAWAADLATTPGRLLDAGIRGSGDPPTPPGAPPPTIPGLGGALDPNDANAMALALADLALEYVKVKNAQEATADATTEANEEWKRQIDIMKMLKIEATPLADAIGKLMDRMGTSTKVDQFTNRIISAAIEIADLAKESERLMEIINPGSTKMAGDDVDAKIFKLRSDPRNWKDGNLTPQALEIESGLLNNHSLGLIANQLNPQTALNTVGSSMLTPMSSMLTPAFGSKFPGSNVMGPSSVTINAQGGFWNSPDQLNQLGRLVEDALAGRSAGTGQFSRR